MSNVSCIKDALSATIRRIEKIRDSLTEENIHLFNIETSENRDLCPIYFGLNPIGFEQISGDILSLKIENRANIGKVFV